MRILHVVTLITPDGAYGGPVRVALNQLKELARRGHEVELVAGASGYEGALPSSLDGVPVRLFPVRSVVPQLGFAGLVAPGLLRYVKGRLITVDVIHVHLARDLVTLTAAAVVSRSTIPLFVQPHGMIAEPTGILKRAIDAFLTRQVLLSSRHVFALTETEASSLRQVGGLGVAIEMTINGVPDSAALGPESVPLNVLFLARLHARKRPVLFVKMAEQLIREGHDATFSLVGPDEGEGAAVTALIQAASIGDRVRWEGSLRPEETLERIARCGVYVLPSVGEVFPMSVLEAMSAGRPIVVTQSNGLASNLSESDAALVVDESLEALVSATRSLIVSKELRSRMGQNAKISASREYSMVTVIDQVERAYEKHLIVGQLS